MATTAEDLLIRIDATTETLRRELTRADQSVAGFARSVDTNVDRATRSLASLGQRARLSGQAAANGMGLANYQLLNLSRQLQDVGVQLAGGQNPLLILAQQGPQAADAVGGMRAALDQRDRQWRQQLGRNIGGIIDQNRRYRG